MREPGNDERTIVTPLADMTGIEDARLISAEAPNYFASAWSERSLVFDRFPRKDAWLDAALAINPALNRTQDHLHIHIGCVVPDVKELLQARKSDISATAFRRLNFKLRGRTYWARLVDDATFSKLSPFQIVAEGVPGAAGNMAAATIGVIGTRLGQRHGFYVLAEVGNNRKHFAGSAEELLDPRCMD